MEIGEFKHTSNDGWDQPQAKNAGVVTQVGGLIGKITGSIGDAPDCRNLKPYFENPGSTLPEVTGHGGDLALLAVRNYFSVRLSEGPIYLNAVGIELRFRDDSSGLNAGIECRVVNLSPSSAFEEVATLKGSVATTMGVKAHSPENLGRLIFEDVGLIPAADFSEKENFGPNINLGAAATLKGTVALRHTWHRRRIEVWGCGSYEAHWKFFRDSQPFTQRDIEVVTVLAFDRFAAANPLTFQARLLLDAWPGIVPKEVQSDWMTLTCKVH